MAPGMDSGVERSLHPALRIARVEAMAISLPLARPVLMGGGQRIERSESLLVRIIAQDGRTGWGEASAAPTMTGETLGGMVAAVRDRIGPVLAGSDALRRLALDRRMAEAAPADTSARAACDAAVHDLVGQHLGVPVATLLGGALRGHVAVMHLLANPTLDEDLAEAASRAREGITLFKLKVGVKPVAEEIAVLSRMREHLGAGCGLCADGNTGMRRDDAIAYARAAGASGLLFLEQPLADDDLDGALAVAGERSVGLCADESAHSLRHVMDWHAAGAITGVNLKTLKLGGLTGLMRAATVADALGLHVNLACKAGESSVGTAALVHLGYCVPNLDWGITPSSHYLAEDIVRSPLRPDRGSLALPSAPGLGVCVDEAAVARFRIDPAA